ncbi:non-ribosomal peptide synthetase, partial [Niastella populi]|uniref:non-ribosomal peptide synthetase n=1 Tax=Niastella populi TaxID=550983 RepID=UPI00105459B0
AIIPVAPQASYPLSFSQRRLWVLSQFEEANIAYNLPRVYVFEGELNREALKFAFDSVIGRHEILRTVFREDEQGEVRQVILPFSKAGFHIVSKDLRNNHQSTQAVEKLVREQFIQPFDLTSGPLLRAGLFQTGDSKWIFTYVMHHIISDGWSMNVLLHELLTFYKSYESGEEPELSPLPIQYKDYASWQQQLGDEALKVHKTYWLQQMEGPLPVLDLPADRVRPAVKTYNGSTLITTLDAGRVRELKTLIRQQGGTLFMGLLALVKTLLYRYTGQQDIIIGSPVAGRDKVGLEEQIGFYLNMLALRTKFEGNDSFYSLLENIKRNTLQAYNHQDYPFDELVEGLSLQRDISRNPLFDVMLILQNQHIDKNNEYYSLGKLQVSPYAGIENIASKFDLSFSFLELEDALHLSIEYNTDIYNEERINRLALHMQQLLAAVTLHPLEPINRLDYLSIAEKQQLLISFNDTTAAYPKEKSIVELWEEQVRLFPDKIALRDEFTQFTYQQLDNRCRQVAAGIMNKIGPGDKAPVGILLTRSASMVATLLGILRTGRPYIPLDPAYPAERLNYILEQSGCELLITEEKISTSVDTSRVTLMYLHSLVADDRVNNAIVNDAVPTEDTAYIIYTSGSTGKPKGIAISHRSVVNFLTSMQQQPGMKAGELLFAVTTISFDIAVLELFLPLLSGGCVYVAGVGTLSDPQRIIAKLQQVKPAVIQATPAFYQMLFESGWQGQKGLKVLCGGDLLSESLADRILKSCGELWNMYGPTETTIWSATKKIEKAADAGNVGKPIHNTTIYITDEQLQPVPVGIPGSIYIGGDGLALGYYRQDALTAERFISSPFNAHQRIYDTGDVGKWNADGTIAFLGRKDNQV